MSIYGLLSFHNPLAGHYRFSFRAMHEVRMRNLEGGRWQTLQQPHKNFTGDGLWDLKGRIKGLIRGFL